MLTMSLFSFWTLLLLRSWLLLLLFSLYHAQINSGCLKFFFFYVALRIQTVILKCSFPWIYSSCSWLSFLKHIIFFSENLGKFLQFFVPHSYYLLCLSILYYPTGFSYSVSFFSPNICNQIFLLTFPVCS